MKRAPALSYYLLPNAKVVEYGDSWLVRKLKGWGTRLLHWSFDNPRKVIVPAVVLVAAASVPFLGRAFLPAFNEGTVTVSMPPPPGIAALMDTTVTARPAICGRRCSACRATLTPACFIC